MKTADKLVGYHNVLRHARWKNDLFDLDKRFWLRMRRPPKATKIFEAHLARVNGEGSPQACDDVLAVLTKR